MIIMHTKQIVDQPFKLKRGTFPEILDQLREISRILPPALPKITG
jgi:hypothetical protein